MALPNVFKVKRKRYVDGDGKQCKKDSPGAKTKIETSSHWYADIAPAESALERIERRKAGLPNPKRQRVKLCVDKDAAKEQLRKLIDAQDRRAAGLVDYHSQTNQPLGPMIDDFQKHLTASGRTKDYIETMIGRIEKPFDGCGFLRLVDIDCGAVEQWLYRQRTIEQNTTPRNIKGTAKTYQEIADRFGVSITTVTYWRRKGAPIIPRRKNDLAAIAKWHSLFTKPTTIGSTTSDHYVTALKRFGSWLVKPAKRAATNPFSDLDKLNDSSDIRKHRRVLNEADFSKLITATTNSERAFRGLSNVDRVMVYLLASYTGLRAGEIASLKTNSFDFGDSPTVTVEAAYTKNSELAVIPLRSDLAERLKGYLDSREVATLSIAQEPETVWPGKWSEVGAEMIRGDLADAGIPYTDDTGKDFDFHALRHQFITGLARAGVSLKSAQELARHSKPELTANIYTHLSLKDTAADVEKLGAIPNGEAPGSVQATGTDTVFRKAIGKQGLTNQATSGNKLALPATAQKTKKPRFHKGKTGVSLSDTDGTRTRNHRIDSPVL